MSCAVSCKLWKLPHSGSLEMICSLFSVLKWFVGKSFLMTKPVQANAAHHLEKRRETVHLVSDTVNREPHLCHHHQSQSLYHNSFFFFFAVAWLFLFFKYFLKISPSAWNIRCVQRFTRFSSRSAQKNKIHMSCLIRRVWSDWKAWGVFEM